MRTKSTVLDENKITSLRAWLRLRCENTYPDGMTESKFLIPVSYIITGSA